jgi:asparagine synthase (glutamine-hydrolysing)
MCGFFGLHLKKKIIIPKNIMQENLNYLKYRGPDYQDFFSINNDYKYSSFSELSKNLFITSRLNIVDNNPKSNQPFFSKCRRFFILFNGEIYNHIEIRRKYFSNEKFSTMSDTETLLKFFMKFNLQKINEIKGIFSICFFDLNKETVFLIRDKIGVKPFFYTSNENFFSYSSDIKCLTNLPNINININKLAIYSFLNGYHENNPEETYFSKIKKINPGSIIVFNLRTNQIKKHINYYELPCIESKFKNDNELLQNKKNIVDTIVHQINFGTNKKIAVTLSGGIDSTLIASIAKKIVKNKKIIFFTYNNEKTNSENDSYFANYVGEYLGAKVNNVKLNEKNFEDDLNNLIYTQSSPVQTFSSLAQYKIYEAIKRNEIKASIDGQGSDEIFCGYKGFFSSLMIDNIRNKKYNDFIVNVISLLKNRNHNLNIFLKFFSHYLPDSSLFFFKDLIINNQLNWVEKSPNMIEMLKEKYFYSEHKESENFLKNEMIKTVYGPMQTLLSSLDCNSMRHSVEARVPYLYDDIVEKNFVLNSKNLISNKLETKKIIRSFTNFIPKKILTRKKIGFETDDNNILKKNVRLIKNIIKSYKAVDFINKKKFLEHLDQFDRGKNVNSSHIIRTFTYILWCKNFKIN